MYDLTCIVCPVGCALEVKEEAQSELSVTGNRCPRGAAYALEEIRSPKRAVTATVAIKGINTAGQIEAGELSIRRLPVKTALPCPREKIPALLRDIYNAEVSLPVKAGDIVISNWNSEGINVVATRSLSAKGN